MERVLELGDYFPTVKSYLLSLLYTLDNGYNVAKDTGAYGYNTPGVKKRRKQVYCMWWPLKKI